MTRTVFVLVLAALGAVALATMTRDESPRSRSMAEPRVRSAATVDPWARRSIESMQRELDQLRARPHEVDVGEVGAGGDSMADTAGPAPETAPGDDEMTRRVRAFYDELYERDASDPSGGRDYEARIEALWDRGDFAALALERLECRATMCQLELGHADGGARDAMKKLWDGEAFRHGMFFHQSANGRRTTVYFAREGGELQTYRPES